MTPEEWDAHWFRIREDAIAAGEPPIAAEVIADRECSEQFGDRPAEEKTA